MAFFTESTLSDSMIFKMFNNNKEMTVRITNAIKNGEPVNPEMISEQLFQIKRTRISPLVDEVIKAYERGAIMLVYTKSIKIPQGIPFVVMKMGGTNKAVVFVSNYGSMSKPDAAGKVFFNAPMKDLYVLMESAYVAYKYYDYPVAFKRSAGLMKSCMSVYTSMILRILNKEYALSLDQSLYDKVSFVISKFFLSKIWELDNSTLCSSYATQGLSSSQNELSLISTEYDNANISTISDLISFIKSLSPKFKSLTVRYFVEAYMNTYKPGAILSVDCLPYFLYVMITTLIGSFMINQPLISDIIKNTKTSSLFYPELNKVVT